MMPVIPSINQAYLLLIHEEGQRTHLIMAALTSHSRLHYEEGESSAMAVFATMMRRGNNVKQKSVLLTNFEEEERSGSTDKGNNYTRSNNNMRVQ